MTPRRIGIVALASAALIGLGGYAAHGAGFYINATNSAPKGLWRVKTITPWDVERGMLVSICPPGLRIVEAMRQQGYLQPGSCSGSGTVPLLKPVVAFSGDTVRITRKGIAVNGQVLPNSQAQPQMPAYPAGVYEVRPGEVWIVSSYSAGSFDSRYFGPVSTNNIEGQAKPIAIMGDVTGMTVRGNAR